MRGVAEEAPDAEPSDDVESAVIVKIRKDCVLDGRRLCNIYAWPKCSNLLRTRVEVQADNTSLLPAGHQIEHAI